MGQKIGTSSSHRRFFVVFRKASKRCFWHWLFCRRGMEHVGVFFQSEFGVCYLDPAYSQLEISTIIDRKHNVDAEAVACLWAGEGDLILQYDAPLVARDKFYPVIDRLVLTCVSVVCYTIGLRGLVLTPQRLYAKLLKRGAIVCDKDWQQKTLRGM